MGGFIHEVDFDDTHLSDIPSIKGAIKTWKSKVVEYSPRKMENICTMDASKKTHLMALKNDFIGLLNRTYYYKKIIIQKILVVIILFGYLTMVAKSSCLNFYTERLKLHIIKE